MEGRQRLLMLFLQEVIPEHKIASLTYAPQEKIRLENDMRTERDLRNQIAYARKSGVEKGLARGREEGREEERLRTQEYLHIITEKLHQKGLSEDEIVAILGQ